MTNWLKQRRRVVLHALPTAISRCDPEPYDYSRWHKDPAPTVHDAWIETIFGNCVAAAFETGPEDNSVDDSATDHFYQGSVRDSYTSGSDNYGRKQGSKWDNKSIRTSGSEDEFFTANVTDESSYATASEGTFDGSFVSDTDTIVEGYKTPSRRKSQIKVQSWLHGSDQELHESHVMSSPASAYQTSLSTFDGPEIDMLD